MLDIEQYPQCRLADVSKVFTSAGFLRVHQSDGDRGQTSIFILCPGTYVPGQMEVSIVEANGFMKGYAVMPEKGLNIVYLTSILNTAVSWAILTDGQLEKRAPITLKRLGNVLVRLLPAREQTAVAYLQYLLMEIRRQKNVDRDNPYLNFWEAKYEETRNAIALELVMPQVFKEYEISLLESWLRQIGKCSAEHPDIGWDEMHEWLGKELLSPQNEVTGNLNKLRVVMREVVEKTVQNL